MRRAPLRRKSRKAKHPTAASIRKASAQALKKECARLCREIVFQRAGNKCEMCGATDKLQWAHVMPRRYRHMIYDPNNGMCLCYRDHFHVWHKSPLEAMRWFEGYRGNHVVENLRFKALAGSGKPDMEATLLYLRSLL